MLSLALEGAPREQERAEGEHWGSPGGAREAEREHYKAAQGRSRLKPERALLVLARKDNRNVPPAQSGRT